MNRSFVWCDVTDNLLHLHFFQAWQSVTHGDSTLRTASHQALGCVPADWAVLRAGQQEACGARTYLFITYRLEVFRFVCCSAGLFLSTFQSLLSLGLSTQFVVLALLERWTKTLFFLFLLWKRCLYGLHHNINENDFNPDNWHSSCKVLNFFLIAVSKYFSKYLYIAPSHLWVWHQYACLKHPHKSL